MKVFVFIETVLLLALVGAAAWYWQDSSKRIASLQGELVAAKAAFDVTDGELVAAKAAFDVTEGELVAAKVAFDATEAKNAKESEILRSAADACTTSLRKAQENQAALHGLFEHFAVTRDNVIKMMLAAMNCDDAQRTLVIQAKQVAYQSFSDALGRLSSTSKEAHDSRGRIVQFMADNVAALAPSRDVVNRVQKFITDMSNIDMGKTADDAIKQVNLRESKFTVLANDGWQTSDLIVKKGEYVCMSATGRWRWGAVMGSAVGPEGERPISPSYVLVDSLGNGALLARIRGSNQIYAGTGSFEADRDGKVEFRINDTAVGDNSGSMDVTMWAFKSLESGF